MIYQQVTLSGDAEWPKVADAVIEAHFSAGDMLVLTGPIFLLVVSVVEAPHHAPIRLKPLT